MRQEDIDRRHPNSTYDAIRLQRSFGIYRLCEFPIREDAGPDHGLTFAVFVASNLRVNQHVTITDVAMKKASLLIRCSLMVGYGPKHEG